MSSRSQTSPTATNASVNGGTAQPRRRVPRGVRERQMLGVAEQVFAARGYQGTSMDEIAERVGVSKPMLYEYFGSKDGLLRACIARIREELRELTERALDSADTLRMALWQGLVAYFEFIENHRQAWAVLLHEPIYLTGPAGQEVEEVRQQQTRLIATKLSDYRQDADYREVQAYAEIVVGGCERIALWRLGHPDVSAHDAARLVMDMIWSGLRAWSAEPTS